MMINVPNWDERKAHYEQYWTRTNRRPVFSVTAPKTDVSFDYPMPKDSDQFWFDADWMVGCNRASNIATYFAGDSFPYVSPSLGPDIMSAILGLEINYNESSSWVKHLDCTLADITDFTLNRSNFHFSKMEEILTRYAADGKDGGFITGMVDLNTLLDGVASLIGPDNLCMEMYDDPEAVKRVTMVHFNLYKQVFTHYYDIITRYQGGSTNWLGLYSDVPWYFISLDFMVMISDAFFEAFADGPLREMAVFHPRVLFHLDGENAVKHLDRILAIDDITGVQVQGLPFTHNAEFWVPHLQKIQKAGKTVMIDARHKDDLLVLLKGLEPEGVFLRTGAQTEEEADTLVSLVNGYYGG